MKILVLHGSKPSKNSVEMVEAAEKMGHTVIAAPTNDVSSLISNEGSRFWVGRDEVSDFDLCFLRSFGPGSTEQATRRISMMEHMEVAGIRVINRLEADRQANQIYPQPKKIFSEKFEIWRNKSLFKNDLFNSFPTYQKFLRS